MTPISASVDQSGYCPNITRARNLRHLRPFARNIQVSFADLWQFPGKSTSELSAFLTGPVRSSRESHQTDLRPSAAPRADPSSLDACGRAVATRAAS